MRQMPFRENRHGCERFRPLCPQKCPSEPAAEQKVSGSGKSPLSIWSWENGEEPFFKQSGTAYTKRLCLSEAFFCMSEKGFGRSGNNAACIKAGHRHDF